MVSPENPQPALRERLSDIAKTVATVALWPIIRPEQSLDRHIAYEHEKLAYWADGKYYDPQEAIEKGRKAYAEQHQPWHHRIRRKTVAVIAAAAVAVPGVTYAMKLDWATDDAPETPSVAISDPPDFSPTMVRGLFADFSRIKDYWKARGIDLSDTSLVRVGGSARYVCGSTTTASEDSIFCPPNNTIAITADTVNEWADVMKGGRPGRYLVLGHELGHAVQHKIDTGEALIPPTKELQATCYAGQTVKDLEPTYIPVITTALAKHAKITYVHGTAAQQSKAFALGATDSSCREQDMLQITTDFPTPVPTATS